MECVEVLSQISRFGFAFAGQPFIEAAQVDHHALMGAATDLLDLVARGHVERDAAAVDPGHLGFGRHFVPDRRRRQMADVDRGKIHATIGDAALKFLDASLNVPRGK